MAQQATARKVLPTSVPVLVTKNGVMALKSQSFTLLSSLMVPDDRLTTQGSQ